MTETDFGTTFTSPRLERPADTPFLGVATALASATGTDVVLWRVLFVVLCFFGGLGAALYLACYVTIPKEGEQHSLASRLVHGPDRRVTTRQLLLLALVVVATVAAVHNNGGWLVAVVAAGLGYAWWRHRRHPGSPVLTYSASPQSAPTAPPPTPTAVATPPEAVPAPAAADPVVGAPAVPVRQPLPPPRTRSVLTKLTLSTAALVVGVLLFLATAGTASLPTEVVLAAALGVVGLGLVASAFWGRARGLVPVAVLLALALGGTVAARPAIDHGVGERHWVVSSAPGTYRLGIGDATLTLPASAAEGQGIVARVSLGHLKVVVPPGVHAVIDAHVQNGDILGPDDVDENGRGVDHRFELGPRTAPVVHVDARVGAGMVEVRRG